MTRFIDLLRRRRAPLSDTSTALEVAHLRRLLAECEDHLSYVEDAGPEGVGWQSKELSALMSRINHTLRGGQP